MLKILGRGSGSFPFATGASSKDFQTGSLIRTGGPAITPNGVIAARLTPTIVSFTLEADFFDASFFFDQKGNLQQRKGS